MKPTREQVIQWARQSGVVVGDYVVNNPTAKEVSALVELAFAAGQASAAQGVEPVAEVVSEGSFGMEVISLVKPDDYSVKPGTRLYTAPPTAAPTANLDGQAVGRLLNTTA